MKLQSIMHCLSLKIYRILIKWITRFYRLQKSLCVLWWLWLPQNRSHIIPRIFVTNHSPRNTNGFFIDKRSSSQPLTNNSISFIAPSSIEPISQSTLITTNEWICSNLDSMLDLVLWLDQCSTIKQEINKLYATLF